MWFLTFWSFCQNVRNNRANWSNYAYTHIWYYEVTTITDACMGPISTRNLQDEAKLSTTYLVSIVPMYLVHISTNCLQAIAISYKRVDHVDRLFSLGPIFHGQQQRPPSKATYSQIKACCRGFQVSGLHRHRYSYILQGVWLLGTFCTI